MVVIKYSRNKGIELIRNRPHSPVVELISENIDQITVTYNIHVLLVFTENNGHIVYYNMLF